MTSLTVRVPLLDGRSLDVIPDAAILSSTELRVVALNSAARRFFGEQADSPIGRDLLSLVRSETVPVVADALLRAARAPGTTTTLRADFWSSEGAGPQELRIAPLFDQDDVLEGYLITLPETDSGMASSESVLSPTPSRPGSDDSLELLARQVAVAAEARCVVVGVLEGSPATHVSTLALLVDGQVQPAARYALAGTPCAEVLDRRTCHFPDRVQQQFPSDLMLQEMGMEGYLGTTIEDSKGEVLGILAVLDGRPLYRAPGLLTTIQSFAARAGAELERRRMLQALEITESRWLEVVRTMADGLVEIAHPSGQVAISPRCATLLGYDTPGTEVPATMERFAPLIHPDDLPTVCACLERAIRDAASCRLAVRLQAADGEYRCFEARTTASRDGTGRVARTLVLLSDVTASHRQRILLDQVRQVGQLSGWSYDIDLDRFDLMPELEAIDGIEGEEIIEVLRKPEEVLSARDAATARNAFAAAASAGTPWDYVYARVLSDGRTVWRRSLARVELRQGVPFRIHGALQDITERCSLEAQLVQSQKMEALGLLAGGVAHDVNNVLMSISGLRELVAVSIAPNHAAQRDLTDIGRSVDSARRLTRQLLAFAQQQVLEPEPVLVSAVVRETSALLHRLLPHGIQVACDICPGLPPVMADRGQFEQVLLNLALNARDAMPDGGRLTISARRVTCPRPAVVASGERPAGDYVEIVVKDTGTGMEPAVLRRIFEPFFTTKERGQGTGLGLPTSLGIIRQMQGHMSVASAPGQGTQFTVWLPATEPAQAAGHAPDKARPSVTSATLLLVDDEPSVRDVTSRILTRKGFTVHTAGTVEEALRIAGGADGRAIDLLITDISLPGFPAVATLHALRERFPKLPVLFTSGHSPETARALGGLGPGNALLPKPYTIDELLQKVREVLQAGVSTLDGDPGVPTR